MVQYEYLDCSMRGSYWIPCEVFGDGGRNADGKVTIRYLDTGPDGDEIPTVEDVAADRVRQVNVS